MYQTTNAFTALQYKRLQKDTHLTRRGVLGDGLGTFRDGVLAQLSGEDQTSGSLDLTGRDGGATVDSSELGSFGSKTLKDILDKGVEDGHGLVADTSVGVDLLQDTVDVGGVCLLADLGALLLVTRLGGLGSLLGGLGGLGGSLTGLRGRGFASSGSGFGCHAREGMCQYVLCMCGV